MKKIIISIFACIVCMSVQAQMIGKEFNKDEKEDIVLTQEGTSHEDVRTRSSIMPVSAWVDFATGQLEIEFSAPQGTATISVVNPAGQCVRSYSCDTSSEWIVWLAIPTCEGFYEIKIQTASALFTGNFTI